MHMVGCAVNDVHGATAFGELGPDVFVDLARNGCDNEWLKVFGVEDHMYPHAGVRMFRHYFLDLTSKTV
jgi:hypothetical protein